MEKDKQYLQDFLNKNRSKKGYKAVISSPLRYAGGKTKAVCLLLENLPLLKEKKIISPFFGGGSVELCLANYLGFEVKGYDIFGMLSNFWNVLKTEKKMFIEELKKMNVNKEDFTKYRHILLAYWETIKPNDLIYNTKNKIDLTEEEQILLINNPVLQAVYYYYNMSLCYGPMFLGWPSSHEINPEKFERRIQKLQSFKMNNVSVECLGFEVSIPKHNEEFLFLDPPYYLGEDSKMFKGMYPNCNFAIHHNNFDHDKLADLLKKHKGGFLLTYNNCAKIRELYKDYKHIFPQWQYSYGQGETRIGDNRKETNSCSKESHEIIIICPPII